MRPHQAPIVAFKNKENIDKSEMVGCYYCKLIFPASDIKDYTDYGETALCPKCDIDSIIPSVTIEITEELLEICNNYWFGRESSNTIKL